MSIPWWNQVNWYLRAVETMWVERPTSEKNVSPSIRCCVKLKDQLGLDVWFPSNTRGFNSRIHTWNTRYHHIWKWNVVQETKKHLTSNIWCVHDKTFLIQPNIYICYDHSTLMEIKLFTTLPAFVSFECLVISLTDLLKLIWQWI